MYTYTLYVYVCVYIYIYIYMYIHIYTHVYKQNTSLKALADVALGHTSWLEPEPVDRDTVFNLLELRNS